MAIKATKIAANRRAKPFIRIDNIIQTPKANCAANSRRKGTLCRDGTDFQRSKRMSNSTATAKVDVQQGSTITATGNVTILSEVVWKHALGATASAFRDGIVGVAVTVALFTTHSDAWADGAAPARLVASKGKVRRAVRPGSLVQVSKSCLITASAYSVRSRKT
jgi:hypothetical protein